MYPYYFMFLRIILGKAAREGPINLYVKRAYKLIILDPALVIAQGNKLLGLRWLGMKYWY